ncbi:MAG: nuclear transport factor 2 family protein [Longimicrobiales bacterium]
MPGEEEIEVGEAIRSTRAEQNAALVKRMFDVYSAHDFDTLRAEIFAPDVVWRVPGHHPLAGPKRGADELIAYFAQLAIAGFAPEVVAVVANDDYVIDVHRGRGSVGDDAVDMLWVLLYKIVDGRIAEVDNFAGDQHAADAFFTKIWGPRLKPVPDRFIAQE